MSKLIKLGTGISTFTTNKSTGVKHVGVNSPHEDQPEVQFKISQVRRERR